MANFKKKIDIKKEILQLLFLDDIKYQAYYLGMFNVEDNITISSEDENTVLITNSRNTTTRVEIKKDENCVVFNYLDPYKGIIYERITLNDALRASVEIDIEVKTINSMNEDKIVNDRFSILKKRKRNITNELSQLNDISYDDVNKINKRKNLKLVYDLLISLVFIIASISVYFTVYKFEAIIIAIFLIILIKILFYVKGRL